MRPIVMFKYRGFLIRVCDNGAQHSYRYEWTFDPVTPATIKRVDASLALTPIWLKQKLKRQVREMMIRLGTVPYDTTGFPRPPIRKPKPRRVYDLTSLPHARGPYSALDYAKCHVDMFMENSSPKRRAKR